MPLLAPAFNYMLNAHGRNVTIERPDEITPANIRIMPGNYFRNLAGPEETIVEGAEFVVSNKNLTDANYPTPKRGDVITDAEIGYRVVSEVREMYDFGGSIMGYRLRTE